MQILDQLQRHGVKPTRLAVDSRRVEPGDVFLAYPGIQADGRAYIAQAVARGAAAVIAEAGQGQKLGTGDTAVPLIEVAALAQLSGEIAHLVYGRPSEQLWLAGVTGTNGKTSVSQWIAQSMSALGCKCGVIGTLGNGFPGALAQSPNTTPDAVTLHRDLAGFVRDGAVACAMEASSIGLHQGRVNGAQFDVAVFTNLTRDHLEYHGSMEAYAAAKDLMFDLPGLSAAVLNLDDEHGRALARRLRGRLPLIGYSLRAEAPAVAVDRLLRAADLDMSGSGVAFGVDGVAFMAPVVGGFNVANLLAVIGALLAGDETLDDIAAVLRRIEPPPGRMQVVGGRGQPLVVIDYAHTPDALDKALAAARQTADARGGRLFCVFGCGGDRDRGKRPQMGAVAERLADSVVLTSDNPRSEDPQAIVAAIAEGMRAAAQVELDRGTAIARAVLDAAAEDVIVVAGKGHEPYQEIAGVKRPFSDVAAAKSALAERRP